jgi:hypothetical protein
VSRKDIIRCQLPEIVGLYRLLRLLRRFWLFLRFLRDRR